MSRFVIFTNPVNLRAGLKGQQTPYQKSTRFEKAVDKQDEPVIYDLYDGPKRGFVREELLVVPPNAQPLRSCETRLALFECGLPAPRICHNKH